MSRQLETIARIETDLEFLMDEVDGPFVIQLPNGIKLTLDLKKEIIVAAQGNSERISVNFKPGGGNHYRIETRTHERNQLTNYIEKG